MLLRKSDTELEVVEYLKQPLNKKELMDLSQKLNLHPKAFIRKRESAFKEQGLKDKQEDRDALFSAMEKYPKIIERPIAVRGTSAVVGRPPEKVLSLLDK